MKKLIKTISLITALLLTFSLLVTFASCNKDDSDEKITNHTDNTEKPTDNAEKPTEAPTEKPTEEVKVDPPVEISAEMESEIKNKWFEKTYAEENKEYYNSPDQVKIKACYGIFDDAYCAIITYPLVEYTCEETKVEVGGYTFVFGSSNTMIVYCDGKIYSLEKAYEKGILDDAELESLYSNYTKARG